MRSSRESFVWLVSVISGLLLLVLLPIHLFLTHTGSLDVLSYDAIRARLSSDLVKFFYGTTIVVLLVHGWIGVRSVLLDLEPSRSQVAVINLAIVAVAFLTLGYSFYILFSIP